MTPGPTRRADAAEPDMDLQKALEIAGWPASLLAPEKRPTIIEDAKVRAAAVRFLTARRRISRHRIAAQEFEDAILYGSHVDDILVLKDGVRKMGQEDAVPPEIMDAVRRERCCRSFLDALSKETLGSLRGRVYCTPSDTHDEYELKKRADGCATTPPPTAPPPHARRAARCFLLRSAACARAAARCSTLCWTSA